jgi:hypothetical protein
MCKSNYACSKQASQSRHCLRVGYWNVEGINTRTGSKLDDPVFVKEIEHYDIVALAETHASVSGALFLNGFKSFEVTRKKHIRARKGSGGIVIFVKNDIRPCVTFHHGSSSDSAWIQLKHQFFNTSEDIFMCAAYISPHHSSYTSTQDTPAWESIRKDVENFGRRGKILIMGDLNTRTGHLPDFIEHDDDKYITVPDSYDTDENFPVKRRNNMDPTIYPATYCSQLTDMCKESGLRILNGRTLGDTVGRLTCYKWNGSSAVDYGIAHHSLLPCIQYFKVHDFLEALSDHCRITTVFKLSYPVIRVQGETNIYDFPSKLRWSPETAELFHAQLTSPESQSNIVRFCSREFHDIDVNTQVTDISDLLIDAAERSQTSHRVLIKKKVSYTNIHRKPHKKWFDTDCWSARRALRELGKKLTKDPRNPFLRDTFFQSRKRYIQLTRYKNRLYRQNMIDKLNELSEKDPKQYWTLLENLRNENKPSKDNSITTEDWMFHYQRLLYKSPDSLYDPEVEHKIQELKSEPYFSKLDHIIKCSEVTDQVRALKLGKSAGLDRISSELVKASLPIMLDTYTQLFNAVLGSGHYPRAWNTGYIVNIYKAGGRDDPANYRGITINSCLGKVFSMVLNKRLQDFIDQNHLMVDSQIGFRKKARTSDHLFIIRTLVDKYVKGQRKPLYICFVDFEKAYDSVWRRGMFLKLLQYGIRGKFFNIIESLYEQSEACIKTESVRSELFQCNSGVKQGDVLSPLLFNMYINDLPDALGQDLDTPVLKTTSVNSLLYADDLAIMSLSAQGLQLAIDKLEKYCQQWRMKVNMSKTKILQINTTGRKCTARFNFGVTILENVQSYKYLGMIINSSGTLNVAKQNMQDRASKAVYKLKTCIRDADVTPKLGIKLFDQLIKPICLYGSEIWGGDNLKSKKYDKEFGFEHCFYSQPIEKVEMSYYKFMLGVPRRTTNAAVRGELGRYPLGIDIILNTLNYVQHLTQNTDNPLLMEAFSLSDEIAQSDKSSWCTFIKDLAPLLQCTYRDLVSNSACIEKCKTLLRSRFQRFWQIQIGLEKQDTGKLSTYRRLKCHFVFENYLDQVSIRQHRVALTRLRVSAHQLNIERGRYSKPITPREKRFCAFCVKQSNLVVEDELHFLLVCPEYADMRCELYNCVDKTCQYFSTMSDVNRLLFLLTAENAVIKAVAKYCHMAFSWRLSPAPSSNATIIQITNTQTNN